MQTDFLEACNFPKCSEFSCGGQKADTWINIKFQVPAPKLGGTRASTKVMGSNMDKKIFFPNLTPGKGYTILAERFLKYSA